jgi:hypothetical protein
MQDFEEKLLALIEERESVLTEIEKTIFTKRYNLSKKHFEIFSVQTVSMIYAIWEGFIQQTFGLYIDELNRLHLPFKNLHDTIQVFHLENTFKQFNEYPDKLTSKARFHEKLREFHLQEHHNIYRIVNTESNISFEVLNKLLEKFNLEKLSPHCGIYTHPNPSLKEMMKTFLDYRNGIAHGGDISAEEKVTQNVYTKYRKLVVDLMYNIHERMMKGIENETYLKI